MRSCLEKDEGAIKESNLFSSLAVQNNESSNGNTKHFVKLVRNSDASQTLSVETLVQTEVSKRQYVPLLVIPVLKNMFLRIVEVMKTPV